MSIYRFDSNFYVEYAFITKDVVLKILWFEKNQINFLTKIRQIIIFSKTNKYTLSTS